MESYHERQHHICPPLNDTFQINIEGNKVIILKVTSKMQTVPSFQKKIKLKYSDLSLEWKQIHSLPLSVTHDIKYITEFQYKLILQMTHYSDLNRLILYFAPFVNQRSSPLSIYIFLVM